MFLVMNSEEERLLPEEKPSELPSVPVSLWDELRDTLNPVMSKYNQWRFCLSALFATIFSLPFLYLIYVDTTDDDGDLETRSNATDLVSTETKDSETPEDDTDGDFDLKVASDLLFLIGAVGIVGFIGSMILMQHLKSKNTRAIVSRFRPRFEANGVDFRFEVANTAGACLPKVRRLVFLPATAAAARPIATAVATTTTATADVESPSPQVSSTPVSTSVTTATATTTNTATTTTMLDANQPSVVDQMMADLNRPL